MYLFYDYNFLEKILRERKFDSLLSGERIRIILKVFLVWDVYKLMFL